MTEIDTDKPYLTSRVLLTFMPDVFFLVEERSEAGGPVQANRTSIFFGGKVNVCRCHEFRSKSKNNVRRSEHFSVIF